jgi:hypothetical protein
MSTLASHEPVAYDPGVPYPSSPDLLVLHALRLMGKRFQGYPGRLAHVLDRVDKGERSWIDRPRGDSFHRVWFELHEDLMATLALTRGQ